jgi:Haem-binding domain
MFIKKIIKWSVLVIIVALIVMQFFRIDKSVPEYDHNQDFLVITSASVEVAQILKTSCYDCHSYETIYPWYSYIAPVSWFMQNHINEGRDELNFSEWGSFSDKRIKKKIKEFIEEVEEGEMPLSSYTLTHQNAKLSKEERDLVIRFFKKL